jgi:putative heme degradation protein
MIDMKKAAMLGGDPADRKEASYWPEYEDRCEDLWADEWLELCRKDDVAVCPQAVMHGKTAVVKALGRTDKDAHRLAQREAIVRFLQQAREVSSCPDLQYFVACWQAAFELEDRDEDKTQTSIAQQFKVTRAAVSKRVVEIRKAANPNTIARSQKSISARKTYALRQMIVGQTRTKIDLTNQQKETNDLWTTN